ncbi:MAG: hypothetical protein JRI95_00465 [Deltaproteobacteria bacterium]|nr:hypothetical protein [Deltaproteobacteria bacterium]MBW2084696.1 hypothetical protein [Deltaproteobacteria bacterium]
MKRLLFSILYLAVISWAFSAEAGFISIQTYATCTVMQDGVRINVTTTNMGDEAAANVQIHAIFQNTVRSSGIKPALKPGESFTAFLTLHPQLSLPGSYPVEVRVDFHDLNGYLFSSLSHASFVYQEGVNMQVFVRPTEVVMTGKTRLRLEVLNMDRVEREVRIRLIVPQELKVNPAEQGLRIKAQGKGKVSFKLKNFSALEGSVYPVISFLEYEADGRHYSNVAESKVRVAQDQNFFKKHSVALIIFGLALGLVVVLFQLLRPDKKA